MSARLLMPVLLAVACSEQKVGTYDTPPTASISSPPSGSSWAEGEQIDFLARVDDAQTDTTGLSLEWNSSIDGALPGATPADSSGSATYSTASLSPGNHVITLRVTDEAAQTGESTVQLTVSEVPDAPTIGLIHPASGESGLEDEPFRFVVRVGDAQDAPADLVLEFESDRDAVFCAPVADDGGLAECEQVLSPGDHALIFRVTDSTGLATQTDAYFAVVAGTAHDDDGDGYTEDQGDCQDGDGSVHPGAKEYYNQRDDDCDGLIDEGTAAYDDDGDGFSELDGDCDDTDPSSWPGAPEGCDGFDNDCDLVVDEETPCYDDDGDGWTEIDGDCDDTGAITYPDAPEVEDGADNDCDGRIDNGTPAYDDDGDGYSENDGDCDDGSAAIGPDATEACDGADNDCDGSADEVNADGCITYYYDYDGDGYGTTVGRCQCGPSGTYTSAYSTDCYDYNADANPAEVNWWSDARGDGSYDYNCDGAQTHYYTDTGSCAWDLFSCPFTSGWDSRDPGCGASAQYVTNCTLSGFPFTSCDTHTSSYTQACR